MEIFLAIDGGGTKTDAVLFDGSGRILSRCLGPGCNPNDRGFKAACQVIGEAVAKLDISGRVCAAFAGISGALTGDFRAKFREFLGELLPEAGHIGVHADAVAALSSGIGRQAGCLLISGTGSIAYARPTAGDNENLIRSGGWGHLLDKGGSGYDLGRDVLYSALCARDGRGSGSLLCELAEERLGGPVSEAIGDIYAGGKAYIASFAPLVFQALEAGDQEAGVILARNMSELARALNAVASRLPEGPCRTVLAGGVFRRFEVMEPYLGPALQREHIFIIPALAPVYGSALEAMALVGYEVGEGFAERFGSGLEGGPAGKMR